MPVEAWDKKIMHENGGEHMSMRRRHTSIVEYNSLIIIADRFRTIGPSSVLCRSKAVPTSATLCWFLFVLDDSF